MALRSRRAPWPADIRLANKGFLIGSEQPGQPKSFTAVKPQDLSAVVPILATPSALNPTFGTTQSYEDLSLGYGQRAQSTPTHRYGVVADPRYYDALGVDASFSRGWCLGPALTAVTPATRDTTNGISDFFELGGHLYALNGRYCLYRQDDATWPVSKDFGVGNAALEPIVFASNTVGVGTEALVALGDTQPIYKFSGATTTTVWAQSGEALYSRCWTTEGRNLWRGDGTTNAIAFCDFDGDPFVLANWSNANAYTIGDKSGVITSLATLVNGTVLCFKTDGIYTLDDQGQDRNLYPDLTFATDAANGKYVTHWLNNLYFTMGRGFRRIRPDFANEEVGPERLTEYDGAVRGVVTATRGDDFYLYAGLVNPDTSDSYLMKFGAWLAPADAEASRVDAWHGSITAAFVGKTITAMYRASTGNHGAPSGHARMFLGFSDGTIQCFTLPCVPNPTGCTQARFALSGKITLPLAHLGFPQDTKAIKGFVVGGPTLDDANYVQVAYRNSVAIDYVDLVDKDHAVVSFNRGPLQEAPAPTSIAVRTLESQLTLVSTGATHSPLVTFFGVEHAVRTRLELVYTTVIIAADHQVRRDGSPLRMSAQDIVDSIQTYAGQPAVAAVLPDTTALDLMVIGYEETTTWDSAQSAWAKGIKTTLARFTAAEPTEAGTYGALEGYTYGQLEAFTYGELQFLI